MYDCKDFKVNLRILAKNAKACSMHVERLLALVKSNARLWNGAPPTVERLSATGLLSQVKCAHKKAGGNASMQSTRENLKKAGVPLACNKSVGLARGQNYGLFEYLDGKITKGASQEQYRREQKAFSQQFKDLPEAEKAVFHARARVKRQAKVPVAPTSETPEEQYNRRSTLFDLSSDREIIRN